ncbi:hypothetical protein [Hymenobacter sediminicola]|uniref:Uncharacterized protein n=1 Tax=Hymenobacter sediminicola TaxID=2761579 RepID=A0A7G7W855_9BACT|nr:hypothetical protein [Hymenobacter sediminicola]QNH62548.1 hypothetical protein H4317_01590 [Hymenobacter sediminicola]
MKRRAFLLCLLFLFAGRRVFGEAFKNGTVEDFLGAALLLMFGAPVAIGLGVYGLLRLTDYEHTANLVITVFLACLAWWFGLFILFDMPANPGRFWFIELCMSAGAAAAGYYGSREEKSDA